MCTINERWVVSLLWNVDFIKAKIMKHFSSSTLPTIYTMANSINFTYPRKLEKNIRNIVTRHHILVKGLKSKGGAICIATFDFIVSLDMPSWQLRSLALNNSPAIISWSSTLLGLPKQKTNLITWRCLTNVTSHSNYI